MTGNLSLSYSDSEAKVFLPWNSPYYLISYDTFKPVNLVLQCFAKPLFTLVGIPSNIVNCVVFWRQGLRDRMNFCLFCLALADMYFLLSVLCVSQIGSFIELADEMLGKEIYFKSNSKGLALTEQARTMTSCINLVISIERCVCIYLPLRANSLMKTSSMGLLLASVFIITQLGFVYNFFHYEVIMKQNNITNQTFLWGGEVSKTFKDNYLLFRGLDIFFLTVLPVCIIVSIFIATIATVVKLRSAIAWRLETSSSGSDSQGQQRALIKMLVLVSCVYIITSIPYVAYILIPVFFHDFDIGGKYQNSFLIMATVARICTEINCSFNFIIYYRHSSRYRLEIKTLLRCLSAKQNIK